MVLSSGSKKKEKERQLPSLSLETLQLSFARKWEVLVVLVVTSPASIAAWHGMLTDGNCGSTGQRDT